MHMAIHALSVNIAIEKNIKLILGEKILQMNMVEEQI